MKILTNQRFATIDNRLLPPLAALLCLLGSSFSIGRSKMSVFFSFAG